MQSACKKLCWRLTRPLSVAASLGAATALGVLLTLALLMPAAQRAQAHGTPYNCVGVYYGNYPNTTQRGVACTGDAHFRLDGCDRHPDGLRARAWYNIRGSVGPGSWDPNGANSGCAHNDFVTMIDYHAICVEQPVGCSGWVRS